MAILLTAVFLLVSLASGSRQHVKIDQSESHPTSLISHLRDYDVDRVLTSHFKRYGMEHDAEHPHFVHPVNSRFSIAALGQSYHVKLAKDMDLFGPNYYEEGQIWRVPIFS